MSNLSIACEMSLNNWMATFPDVIPEAEKSEKHEKWKKKLFDKMRGDRYHRFTTKAIKVMLVAAILSALMLTAFVIPSSREFIIDNLDNFSRYKITENNKNSVNGEIIVGYIPEGFEYSESLDMGKQKMTKYVNSDGYFFTVIKTSSASVVNFNTENNVSEEFIINGVKYIYCKGDSGINNLIWTKNDYVYRIDGNISFEEFLKISGKIL